MCSRGVCPVDVCVSLQTVGVLTVAKALVSGVYRCVASNPSGTDHLDVHFYVTGDAEIKMPCLYIKEEVKKRS